MGKYRTSRGNRRWGRRTLGRAAKMVLKYGFRKSSWTNRRGRGKSLIELSSKNPNKKRRLSQGRRPSAFGPVRTVQDPDNDAFRVIKVGHAFKPPKVSKSFATRVNRAMDPPTTSIMREPFRLSNDAKDDEKSGIWYYIPVFDSGYTYNLLTDTYNAAGGVSDNYLLDGLDFHLLGGHAEIQLISAVNFNHNVTLYEAVPRTGFPYDVANSRASLNTYLDGGWRANASTIIPGTAAISHQDIGATIYQNERITAWFKIKHLKSFVMRPGEQDTVKFSHPSVSINHIRDANPLNYLDTRYAKVLIMHVTPQVGVDAVTKYTAFGGSFVNGLITQTGYCCKRFASNYTINVHSTVDAVGDQSVVEIINDESDAKVAQAQI